MPGSVVGRLQKQDVTSAHPSPPDSHCMEKPGQQAWRWRRGAFPCRVCPCHSSSTAHWPERSFSSLCRNSLETEAPPKQTQVLSTAGRDLLFLNHKDNYLRIKWAPHSLRRALTPLRGQGLGEDLRCSLGSGDKPSPLASLTPALGCPGGLTPVPPSFPQVEKLVKYLDPNDLGRINFKDFCRGVFAMKGEIFLGRGSQGLPGSCLSGRLVWLGFQLRFLPVGVPGAQTVFRKC